MAIIMVNNDEQTGDKVIIVNPEHDDEITLATANTYVDKNIKIIIPPTSVVGSTDHEENYLSPLMVKQAMDEGKTVILHSLVNFQDDVIDVTLNSFFYTEALDTVVASGLISLNQNDIYTFELHGNILDDQGWIQQGPYKISTQDYVDGKIDEFYQTIWDGTYYP